MGLDMAEQVRSVPVEIDGVVVHVVARQAPGEREVSFKGLDLEGAFAGVEAMAKRVAGLLTTVSPDKASVELEIGLEVGKDGIVAKFFGVAGDGSFKMKLEWERNRSSNATDS
jgi:Trypsin-co-occurring domain 1